MLPGLLLSLRVTCLVAALGAIESSAQSAANSPGDVANAPQTQPYRLHTTVTRIQIPTLVLDREWKPVTGLKREMFSISLDSGPSFQPTYSRLQGDDPISLAVLIDASGSETELTSRIADGLTSLIPSSLGPADHISLFIADCRMLRTRLNVPANVQDIRNGVEQAFTAIRASDDGSLGHCKDSFRLWDFAALMFAQMQYLSGHHVALLLSGGHDTASGIGVKEASRMAGRYAVSVFGVRDRSEVLDTNSAHAASPALFGKKAEDPFQILCASDGGFVQNIDPTKLSAALQNLLSLVRSRYLIEFPEPVPDKPGLHGIVVSVPSKKQALVRYAGVASVLRPSDHAEDPSEILENGSPAVYGNRRPLTTGH